MSPARKKVLKDEHLIDFEQPFTGADPAVQALIEEGSRQRYEAHLSRRER